MWKILTILLIFCFMHVIICYKKVSIIKNKPVSDCPNCKCTVEIPIKSSSFLTEFTFCGKYRFKFLKEAILMYMDIPKISIRFYDFDEQLGILKHNDVGYFFFYPNQTMIPNSWQHICLSVSINSMKFVLNGEVVFNTPLNSVLNNFKETTLWLGGENKPEYMYRRFEGMITDAYLWNESLEMNDLVLITIANKSSESVGIESLFSWNKFKLDNTPSCVEYQTLGEDDQLFQENIHLLEALLIEHQATFEASRYLCKAFGGELFVPQNDYDLDKVSANIKESNKCISSYFGLKKKHDNKVVDLNGNDLSFSRWNKNEPNGKQYEKCINIYKDARYNDINCFEETCFVCEMSRKHVFSLRGAIPVGLDRHYFLEMSGNETEIQGFKETECVWNQTWYFGNQLKLDVSSYIPPVGAKIWSNGHKLKFTQCNEMEFTCHTYGHCISLDKRCDGSKDCILDGSDEKNCTFMTLEEDYNMEYPSGTNTTVSVSLDIYDVFDIKELEMKFRVYFKIVLLWYDSRILFRNLKPNQEDNHLSTNAYNAYNNIKKIWTPRLLFFKNAIGHITAGEQMSNNALADFSGTGYVSVIRKGKCQQNRIEEPDEDCVYPGSENPLRMENWVSVVLDCQFHLAMYPFDSQECPMKLVKPVNYASEFVMQWKKYPHLHGLNHLEYEVDDLHFNYTKSTLNEITVYVHLRRRITFHIFNTYLPSFCLMVIAVFTLFIDVSHFEATIMVTLTSMLVIYTLHQSISSNLPQTSYMKMIDVWLVTGMIVPFVIIAVLVILDRMIIRESNQVNEIGNDGQKYRWNSKMFLKSMQIILPLTIGFFCIIYWTIGLSYYYHGFD